MLKRQIKIGEKYNAKVSEKMTVVRILGVSRFGGWVAINENTGREIRIKSAAKLRSVA